ncbi:hypothetical protein [Desulfurobacterium sp.]
MRKKLLAGTLAALACSGFILYQNASAVVGPCVNCHTMHNSQHGVYPWDSNTTYATGTVSSTNVVAMTFANLNSTNATPIRNLLRGDCQYCHTYGEAPKAATLYYGDHLWPYVDSTTQPEYPATGDAYTTGNYSTATWGENRALAGGSFYWGRTKDPRCAHNVADLGMPPDPNIGLTPPGWDSNATHFTDAIFGSKVANGEATWTHQLTCAGVYGCHGRHNAATLDSFAGVNGAHHSNMYGWVNGTGTIGNSYRFLAGIAGYEHDYYEYAAVPDANGVSHNIYYGVDRTSEDPTTANPHTISYLCAECHGMFHSGAEISKDPNTIDSPIGTPWLRHPTDFDLSNAGPATIGVDGNTLPEYRYYNGGNGTSSPYSMFAPVATDNYTLLTDNTISWTGDDAIVTCVSCHRAHGSPYYDLLRWDYSTCIADSATTNATLMNKCGCMVCHTTKG